MKLIIEDIKSLIENPDKRDDLRACQISHELDQMKDIQHFCLHNIGARLTQPEEIIHFLCHLLVDGYQLGYNRCKSDIDCRELERIAK